MSYENRTLPCVGKNLTPFKLSHRTLRCVGKNLTHMNTRNVQRLDVSVFLFGGQHATTISRCFCFYFSFAPDRSIARRLSHPSNPLPFSFKMPRRFLPRDIRLHLSPSLKVSASRHQVALSSILVVLRLQWRRLHPAALLQSKSGSS